MGSVGGRGKREGMVGRLTRPHAPRGRSPRDQVRELQRRRWIAAKRSPQRRFHASYDRIYRPDILWEAWRRVKRKRASYLQREPSVRSMKRARVNELTSRRWHGVKDARVLIRKLNPVLRGWGSYFRTGNAARRFKPVDSHVGGRLKRLQVKRKGRTLRAGEAAHWTREFFESLGLHRLRGTVNYPGPPFWETV